MNKIVSGHVTTVFRCWKRPTVKTGGTLATRSGVLKIESVEAIEEDAITEHDLAAAAAATRGELLRGLAGREGSIYRIKLRYEGEDPRLALRNSINLSEEEVQQLKKKLDRLDSSNTRGPWTLNYLKLIREHPNTRAAELARLLDLDKQTFKIKVRKLKALGLTESLRPGYRLSPRGEAVLKTLTG